MMGCCAATANVSAIAPDQLLLAAFAAFAAWLGTFSSNEQLNQFTAFRRMKRASLEMAQEVTPASALGLN